MTLLESYDPTTDRIADAAALNAATSTAPFMDSARADSLRRRNRAVLFGNYAGSNLDWKPSFSEVLGLMLRTETTLGASLDRRETPNFAPLDNYNGVDAVMGTPYEAYALSFVFSRSPEETQYIKRDLDQAQKHQLVFSQSDMGTVLGTGFIAGILEPLNLIFGAAPGVMTSVGKSLIQAAKVGAKVSAAQAITVEAGLHYFQPERTLEQSTVDVGLSTAFGASLLPMIVLGKKLHNKMGIEHPELLRAMDESMQQEFRTGTTTGFTGHMNPGWRPERPGERRHAPGVNNPASPGARALPPHRRQGAKGQLFTRADAEPTGFKAYGAERISNILSKRDLVLNGSIPASARAMENLLTTPSYLEKNFNNVATDLPVAREMKTWEATLAEFLTDVNHAHSAYRMRVAKKEGKASFLDKTGFIVDDLRNKTSPARNADDPEGPLSIIAFREEITTALRGVDDTGKIEHRIPEVQQMAQRVRDTNDYIFKEAVAVGIMKESDYRSNFIQRMWDQPEVYKNESRLYNMIWKWQKDNLPSELRDSPQQLSEKIKTIHVSVDGLDNITGEGFEGAKGIFKERTINVPDELIADFLVHDIDHIMRSYVRLASADIEIARKFGSISMEKTFEFIRREAADMDAKAATGSKQQLVAEKHIEYLEAYRDILRGVYQLPSDPYSISSRTARMVLDFNTWTMLGGATLASIPDVGRSVMMNGLSPTFHGVRALIKDFDTWKVAAKEVKLAGTALDMILQTRALALTHHGDLPQRYTRAEKIAGYMTNGFFIANFLSPWNAFMKQAVGVSTSHRILELVKQDVNGTISAKNRTRLRAAYITLEDSRLIDNAFNKYGETVNGLKLPNTERWAEDPRRPVRTEEPIDQPVLIRDRYSDESMMPHTEPFISGDEFEDIIDLATSIDRIIKENPNAGIAAASEFFVPGQVVRELTPERLVDEINALRHAIDTGDTVDITIALNNLVRKLPEEDLDIGGSYVVLDDLMKSEKIIGRSTSLARRALARAFMGEESRPRSKELLEVKRLFDEIIAGIAGKREIDVTTSTQVGPMEMETRVKRLPYKNRKEAIAHYENFLADEKIRALFSEQWAGDILPKMEADLRDYKAGRKPDEVRETLLDFSETSERIKSLAGYHIDRMAEEGMPDAGPSIPGKELPEVFNRLDVIINRLKRYSDQQGTSTPKSINIDELDELISGLGTTEVGPQGVLSSARIARNKEVSIEVKRIVDDFRQQIDTLRTAIKNENVDDIKIASAAISRLIEETRPPTGLGRLPLINPKAEKLHAHPRAKLAEAINLLEMEDTVGKARDTLFQRIDEIVAITGPLGRDFRGAPTGHKEAVEVNKALNKQFKTLHAKYTLLKRSPKRVLGLVRDNISLIQEYFGSHTARLVLSDVEEIANGAKLGSKRDQFGIKDSMDEVLDLTRDLIDKDPSDFDFTTPMPDTGQGVSPPEIPPVFDGRRASENLRAQKVFRAALSRDVDQAIVTPEAGDLPLFTYKIWGRLLGQYKSFIASAFHKVLIPGMQMHDAQTVLGMMMMTFLGGLVTMIRDKQNGVPLADSPLEFVVDGIDQSGLTSWFFVANNAVEAWSDNRYGLRPGLGIGPWWPTSMRWKLGTALGPSASQAVRAGQIMGDLLSGEADWRTRRSAWRLVPGNNLLPLNLGNVIQFNNWMDRMQEFSTPDMEAAEISIR